jgi:hypothetical protein
MGVFSLVKIRAFQKRKLFIIFSMALECYTMCTRLQCAEAHHKTNTEISRHLDASFRHTLQRPVQYLLPFAASILSILWSFIFPAVDISDLFFWWRWSNCCCQARQKTRRLRHDVRGLVSYCCQLSSREKPCLNIWWMCTKGKKLKLSL